MGGSDGARLGSPNLSSLQKAISSTLSVSSCLAVHHPLAPRPMKEKSCRNATILSCPALQTTGGSYHVRYQAVNGSFQLLSPERFEEFFEVERMARGYGGHRRLCCWRATVFWRSCAVIEGPMLGGMTGSAMTRILCDRQGLGFLIAARDARFWRSTSEEKRPNYGRDSVK